MGTLLSLQPPGPLLAARLAAFGVPLTQAEAMRAFRAEIAYYRAHHLDGFDRAALADLRDRCAAEMHAALPQSAAQRIDVPALREAMLASLRFEPAPGALEALASLRAAGLRLVVLSNWDVSLEDALQQTGVLRYLDGVVTSAAFGAAKPDPSIFAHALAIAGADAARAVHVGDSPELDVVGARRAGIRPILVGERAAAAAEADTVESITTLHELPSLVLAHDDAR